MRRCVLALKPLHWASVEQVFGTSAQPLVISERASPYTASRISIEEGTRAYVRLKAQVEAAGVLDRSLLYYGAMTLFTLAGYALSSWGIFSSQNYLVLTLACLGFSFFSVQCAGLMHDASHRAVFASNRINSIFGVVWSVLLGMVFDNWRTRHNAHHAYSNRIGKDPDTRIPFVALHETLAGEKSTFEGGLMRYQAYYFHLLGALVSFSNRLGTFSYFRQKRRAPWQLGLYLMATAFLFVSPFLLFDPGKAIFVFLVVHISSGFYLASCFAPNHKGMAIIAEDQKISFLEQQVITSRNVRGGFLTDIVLVGLNWQTEHHLFPNCPRNKLHLIQPYLLTTCDELGIPYTEVSLIETNKVILRQLGKVARQAQRGSNESAIDALARDS